MTLNSQLQPQMRWVTLYGESDRRTILSLELLLPCLRITGSSLLLPTHTQHRCPCSVPRGLSFHPVYIDGIKTIVQIFFLKTPVSGANSLDCPPIVTQNIPGLNPSSSFSLPSKLLCPPHGELIVCHAAVQAARELGRLEEPPVPLSPWPVVNSPSASPDLLYCLVLAVTHCRLPIATAPFISAAFSSPFAFLIRMFLFN